MENHDYVIIVAGGKGMRMGTDVPKQFLPVGGLPVLMHTIRKFRNFNDRMRIILVLPKHQQEYWKELCERHSFCEPIVIADDGETRLFSAPFLLADGGETRFHSVKNGLDCIPDDACGTVGVHDGVRPFVSADSIRRTYAKAAEMGAAVPVVPVVDTLRHLLKSDKQNASDATTTAATSQDGGETPSETVPRSEYRIVQTPQAFGIRLLKEAYAQDYSEAFTDDASVVEHLGHEVALVEGNQENIKITRPFDMAVAEVILQQESIILKQQTSGNSR